jgi:hypothetical protein
MATHHGLGDQRQHLSHQGAAAIAPTFYFTDSQGGCSHAVAGAADPERRSTSSSPFATQLVRSSPGGALIPRLGYTSVADLYARQLRLRLPQATATINHFNNPSPSADDSSSSTTYDIDITEVLVQLGGPPQRSSNFKSSTILSCYRELFPLGRPVTASSATTAATTYR